MINATMAPPVGPLDPLEKILYEPYNPTLLYTIPVIAALTIHLGCQFYEPYGHHIMFGSVPYFALGTYLFHRTWDIPALDAFWIPWRLLAVFWVTICSTMFVYRFFFHPINHIPGPWWCRFTTWTWVPIDLKGQRHHVLQALHKQYGPVVRTGPNLLSINDPKALPIVYGANSVRGPWYRAQTLTPGVYSLQNEPTQAAHAARRRLWDPAFSVKALSSYRATVLGTKEELMDMLEDHAKAGKPLDLRSTMLFFGFDAMAKIGFGKSFELLGKEDNRAIMHGVEGVPFAVNAIGNVPYIMPILPYIYNPMAKFRQWVINALRWRISKIDDSAYDHPDVLAYLLGEEGRASKEASNGNGKAAKVKDMSADLESLFQDAQLLVVAGSDTAANTMTNTLMELSQQPALLARLRTEVQALFPNGTPPEDFDMLKDQAPLLNACIQESLRLWPVVPTGLQRTLTKPATLPGGYAVPARTAVSTHTWSMHRDPDNWYRPEEFLPDRWLREGSVSPAMEPHNPKAWVPFGWGATSCIGKQLAYMEMRVVLASLVARFDLHITPEAAQAYRDSFVDHFVSGNDELMVNVSLRAQ